MTGSGSGAAPPWAQPVQTSSDSKPYLTFVYGCTQEVVVPGTPQLIVVYADASTVKLSAGSAAISSVQIGGDVPTTTLTLQVCTVSDGKGGACDIVGWPFYVEAGAFTTGTANIYARADATDGTMQYRVIGGDGLGNGALNWTDAENIPMQLLPRATLITPGWDKTVGSGKDYATLQAAFNDLAATAPAGVRPRFTIYDNGSTQIMTGKTIAAHYKDGEGYCHVRTANSGVAATVQVRAAFDPVNTGGGDWDWWPGCEQIRWGSGLTLNLAYMQNYKSYTNTRPPHFWGCTVTNGVASRAAVESMWNGQPHPPFSSDFAFAGPGTAPFYVDNCTINYVNMGGATRRFRHNTATGVYAGRMIGSRCICYNTIDDLGIDPIQTRDSPTPTNWGPLFRIDYTDSGGKTTSGYDSFGADNPGAANCYIEVYENGATVFKTEWANSINSHLYVPASGSVAGNKPTEIQADFNAKAAANGSRFFMTLITTDASLWLMFMNDCGRLKVNLKGSFFSGAGTDPAVGVGTYTATGGVGSHTELYFMSSGNYALNDNYGVFRNRMTLISYATSFLNTDDVGTVIVTDNVVTQNETFPNGNTSSQAGRQFVWKNNYAYDGFRPGNASVALGAWCQITRNVYPKALSRIEPALTTWPTNMYRDNMFVSADNPNGINGNSGNVPLANLAAWKVLVTNYAAGDFTPLAAGGLYTNPVANDAQSYDINNVLRVANGGIMGAYKG